MRHVSNVPNPSKLALCHSRISDRLGIAISFSGKTKPETPVGVTSPATSVAAEIIAHDLTACSHSCLAEVAASNANGANRQRPRKKLPWRLAHSTIKGISIQL